MKKIIHLDADCFYAAVELKRRPELKAFPVAIGGDPCGRGVIATCNYKARTYGVKSAMSSSYALRLCPTLQFIPPDMALYKETSQRIFDIYRRYTKKIETLSLDEAYLDMSDSLLFGGSATRAAIDIQQKVKCELDLSVSAGVAPLKYLAKIASEWRKPAGIFTISPSAVTSFLDPLPLKYLPGVGPKTWEKLLSCGLSTCADVKAADFGFVKENFGRFSFALLLMSEGKYDSEVRSNSKRKSISVESTFQTDVVELGELHHALSRLVNSLSERYRSVRIKCDKKYVIEKLFIKLTFSDFSRTSKEMTVRGCDESLSLPLFSNLLQQARHRSRLPIRLLGVGIRFAGVECSGQLAFEF